MPKDVNLYIIEHISEEYFDRVSKAKEMYDVTHEDNIEELMKKIPDWIINNEQFINNVSKKGISGLLKRLTNKDLIKGIINREEITIDDILNINKNIIPYTTEDIYELSTYNINMIMTLDIRRQEVYFLDEVDIIEDIEEREGIKEYKSRYGKFILESNKLEYIDNQGHRYKIQNPMHIKEEIKNKEKEYYKEEIER